MSSANHTDARIEAPRLASPNGAEAPQDVKIPDGPQEGTDLAAPVVFVDANDNLICMIPLAKIPQPFARGMLLEADFAVRQHYDKIRKREIARKQISLPRFAKEQLAKVGRLFIP